MAAANPFANECGEQLREIGHSLGRASDVDSIVAQVGNGLLALNLGREGDYSLQKLDSFLLEAEVIDEETDARRLGVEFIIDAALTVPVNEKNQYREQKQKGQIVSQFSKGLAASPVGVRTAKRWIGDRLTDRTLEYAGSPNYIKYNASLHFFGITMHSRQLSVPAQATFMTKFALRAVNPKAASR